MWSSRTRKAKSSSGNSTTGPMNISKKGTTNAAEIFQFSLLFTVNKLFQTFPEINFVKDSQIPRIQFIIIKI